MGLRRRGEISPRRAIGALVEMTLWGRSSLVPKGVGMELRPVPTPEGRLDETSLLGRWGFGVCRGPCGDFVDGDDGNE